MIEQSVAILDSAGESALTFRALAARLGGGVASIYWYVDNKDDLLARSANHVLADILTQTERFTGNADPIDNLRGLAAAFFDTTSARPWLAAYFLRPSPAQQPNELLIYERIGQQVMRLGLSTRQGFHAVTALIGFVVGLAADVAQQSAATTPAGPAEQREYAADAWRQLDAHDFPFIHSVVEEFAHHDDTAQFRDGLDLLLAGLRLQAESADPTD